MRTTIHAIALLFLLAGPAAARQATRPAAPSIDAPYRAVLEAIVTEQGLVRYDRLDDDDLRATLERAVAAYARAPKPEERAERIARWCNAYNANVLLLAYRAQKAPGFESVVKVKGFFDERTITVAGETLTLNALENERLRPLRDARIHAALVCAAMSCPPLRREPYRAAALDRQFDDQCRRWVNDATKFRVVDGAPGLSRILEWYRADFDVEPWHGPAGFARAWAASGSPLARALAGDAPPVFLEYDWRLNAAGAP